MDEIKVNHGIIRSNNGIKASEVEGLRNRIRIGDRYRCPRMVKDANGDLVERWEKVRVTGKYPHLVTVNGQGRSIQSERLHIWIF